MTFKEFGYIADAIKTYFPRDNVLPTEHAMSLWYEGLKDLPYQIVSIALKKYVQTNKFSPTIADIREQAEQLNQNNQKTDLNENEAWTLVLKAIQRSGYYSEEEFAKLPKIIQRTIGSSSRLREMALDEKFNHGVESSNFQNKFRIEQQKEREKQKLSPDVSRLIHEKPIPQINQEKTLSIEEQRMIAEENARPAPEDFMKNVMEVLKIGKSGKTQAIT